MRNAPRSVDSASLDFELGDILEDEITGFQGTAIARILYLNNCDRMVLQPAELKDGTLHDHHMFDILNLKKIGTSTIQVWEPKSKPEDRPELGDIVECLHNGIQGMLTALTIWSNGCLRLQIQPKGLHQGQPIKAMNIDENEARIVTRARPRQPAQAPEPLPAKTGGPMDDPPRNR